MGTNLVSGTATALVILTGDRTQFGSLAKNVVNQRALTSFDKGVNRVTWVLIRFMLVMVPVVFLLNGFVKGDFKQAFLFAIAVAVGLTPEMLPMVVTANLARGAVAMSRHKVIVNRLNAIQNLGAMDVLCTDKTGTLTEDKVILEKHLNLTGRSDLRVLELAYLNSYYQTGLKNLLDRAVLEHVELAHEFDVLQHYTKVDEIPFDFTRRRMSVVVANGDARHVLICKGAVEEMLTVCTGAELGADVVALSAERQRDALTLVRGLNEEGFRVVAVASKTLPPQDETYSVNDERDLVLAGFMAFLDPPKTSASQAVAALQGHGVRVVILTGDNDVVTRRVCRDVGLPFDRVVLGHEVDDASDAELADLAEATAVFAKLNPAQKARIVRALQGRGHTVGYLGDGINDAPALRDADVGISVDTATDIARESADIILLEKSLLVLEDGVLRGREVYGNIVKYIKMTASSNFGNVFSVLIASAVLPFLPMLPVQLLIQNLLYDFSQLSLPWDRMDPEFLTKPRKWDASGIARFMAYIGPISSVFDVTTFAVLWFVMGASTVAHQGLFQSGWFIEGLLSQTLIVHMIRTKKVPFIQSTAALPVLLLDDGRDGRRHLSAVLTTWPRDWDGPTAVDLLPVARRYIAGVLCPHSGREDLVHWALSRLAVRRDGHDALRDCLRSLSLSVLLVIGRATVVPAQTAPDTPPAETTMFSHPTDSRWWLSGQVNLISQTHGRFTSPYQGDNSLRPDPEQALSRLWTIYTGVKLPGHTELLFDIESAGGRGLSDALGLAGFTNLDVVRNPTLGSAPYIARAMVHVTLPLGHEVVDTTPTAFSLAAHVPGRRIEIRAGKLGMADFFDVNAVGSDSHLQFTNWTIDNNGAYDYAADTRGYTYAAIVEYSHAEMVPAVRRGLDARRGERD